jgi:C4-dicarboxylate-specific signal transduction histidine kinase
MLTARADDETKLQALAAGASDFLSKPFSTAELRVRLKNLVDTHRLQKALTWQNQKLEATLEQLKETELQLVQSEKLASLGRMSAGIIHEINNPINFAKTGLYTLTRQARHVPETERADYEETLRDIEEGLTRVAGIVSDLRAFTHPQGGLIEEVDVSQCVAGALRFLAAEWKDRVEVHNEIAPGFSVHANRNKLIQVFVNLLQNSLDAVHARTDPSQPPAIRISTSEAEDVKRVVFWDNGVGIGAQDLGKIFDPFFTTKDVGQGTGLGLSICYRIITEFGGRILARTEPGQFCEFTLEFPAHA